MKAKSKGYQWMVSIEKANERLSICQSCPFFKYDQVNPESGVADGRCLKCGCFDILGCLKANAKVGPNKRPS